MTTIEVKYLLSYSIILDLARSGLSIIHRLGPKFRSTRLRSQERDLVTRTPGPSRGSGNVLNTSSRKRLIYRYTPVEEGYEIASVEYYLTYVFVFIPTLIEDSSVSNL